MLINFCNAVMKPVITCSGACHEGFEVENLISSDISERQRGYLGYGSPPTFITIQFLSHVNIKHIIIGPQVRSKKSLGLEILAKRAWSKGQLSQPAANIVNEDDFARIGCTQLGDSDKGVIFHEINYKPNSNIEHNFQCKSLFKTSVVANTNCIRVKIFKALSSVPALSRVEVWGEPGRSCSRSFKNHVYKLWQQSGQGTHTNVEMVSRPRDINVPKLSAIPAIKTTRTISISKCLPEEQAPEEFIDPISCKLMTLPFILPSGKVVDVETLEQHKNYETMYGRHPSDPFTGICFTSENFPIPDNDLKRRLDRFLSENAHKEEFHNVPRTVGRLANHRPRQDLQIDEKCQYLPEELKQGDQIESFHYFPKWRSASYSTKPDQNHCKANPTARPNSQLKRKRDLNNGAISTKTLKLDCVNVHSVSEKELLVGSKSHEERLDASLDSALKSALAGLPSFVKINCDKKQSEFSGKGCSFCKSSEMLFIIPCKHFVCRTCLSINVKNNQINCNNCKVNHPSSCIERFHYQ